MRAALAAAPERAAARLWVAAIGKAATAMALGAHDALGTAIERTLIITHASIGLPELRTRCAPEVWLSAHPVPDERSLAAGQRLLAWVEELPVAARPLFLISGGSSSLVEVLRPDTTLRDLEELTRMALAGGLGIGELNARRAALSRIKGGQLAAHLQGRAGRALFVSDVPDDDPRVIGSGLMGPAISGADHIERQVVACVDHAVAAVASGATALGLEAHAAPRRFHGAAARLAARFAHELRLFLPRCEEA